jgi:hypothetical protein
MLQIFASHGPYMPRVLAILQGVKHNAKTHKTAREASKWLPF